MHEAMSYLPYHNSLQCHALLDLQQVKLQVQSTIFWSMLMPTDIHISSSLQLLTVYTISSRQREISITMSMQSVTQLTPCHGQLVLRAFLISKMSTFTYNHPDILIMPCNHVTTRARI